MEVKNINERVLVYCKSNYAFYLGLYLMKSGRDVEFIVFDTRNKNLMNEMGLKYRVIDKAKLSAIGMFRYPFHVIKQLVFLRKTIGTDKLVFCHYQFELFLFLFIGLFRKRVRFEYCPIEPEVSSTGWRLEVLRGKVLSNLAEMVWFFLLKAMFMPVKLLVFNNQLFIRLQVKRETMEFILEDLSFLDIVTHSVLKRPADIDIISNLYIGQNECLEGIYPLEQIEELRMLLRSFGFHIKGHPGGYPLLFSENEVNFGGPSEFILPKVNHFLIAVGSTTLITASHIYAELGDGPTIISLIRILNSKVESTHTQLEDRMVSQMNTSHPIQFPATFAELKALLNDTNAEKDL